jgi:drug/metabolite transporter (DMT)-like permease
MMSIQHASPALAYAMLLFVLLATALAQIAFKAWHHSGRRVALAMAVLLFVCIPPFTILSARQLGIGKVYVLMSLSYGLVAFMGWKLFGEPVSRRQVQGLALITLGCIVYTL